MAVNFSSSEKEITEEECGDFQLPSKRRRLKQCGHSELDVQNASSEVEIVGLGEVNQKIEGVSANTTEDGLVRVKEEILDQDYGNSGGNVLNSVSRSKTSISFY